MGSSLSVVIAAGINPPMSTSSKPADGTDGDPLSSSTLALDAETGRVLWSYEMPPWRGPAAGDSATRMCLPDSSANIAIGGDGVVYVPHADGVLYALADRNGDGTISDDEVSRYDFGQTFQGSPAIAPGMLAVAPCNGLAAWVGAPDAAPSVARGLGGARH
jgi:glucose dehydrogenase